MPFRAKVIVAALVMIPAVLTQTPARADWCAQYSDGLENCGFSTFEQCRASMGIKGFCRPSQYNPGYAGSRNGFFEAGVAITHELASNPREAGADVYGPPHCAAIRGGIRQQGL